MPIIRVLGHEDDPSEDALVQDKGYDYGSSDSESWYEHEEGYYDSSPKEEVPEPDPPDHPWHPTPGSSWLAKSHIAKDDVSDDDDWCSYVPTGSQAPKELVVPTTSHKYAGSQAPKRVSATSGAPNVGNNSTSLQQVLQHISERLARMETSRGIPSAPIPVTRSYHDPEQVEVLCDKVATPSSNRELPTRFRDSIPHAGDRSKPSLAPSRESNDLGHVVCREPSMSNLPLNHTLGLQLVSSQQTNTREPNDSIVVEEPPTKPSNDITHLPEAATRPCERQIEDLTRSFCSGLNIHSETAHCEDLSRSKVLESRVSYGEDQTMLRGNGLQSKRPTTKVSAHSFIPGFDIHRPIIPFEGLSRARISPEGLPKVLVHEPLIRISREPWELSAGIFARLFPLGFNMHQVIMYLEGSSRARISLEPSYEELVHKALPEACSEPWKEQSGETTRSVNPSLKIHSQVEYFKGFDRSRTSDHRFGIDNDQEVLPRHDPRKGQLTCSSSARSSTSGFKFHQPSVYGKANSRGKSSLGRAYLRDSPYTSFKAERQRKSTTHLPSMHGFSIGFHICCENTYEEVFGQGKTSLDRPVLRDGPQGSLPPYTGRTDLSTPSGHGNHYPYWLGHVLMKPTSPLKSSASTSFVARPRKSSCDLSGEVLTFSLESLLFPFDPGKPNDYCFHDAADLFSFGSRLGTGFEVKTSIKREGMIRAWLHGPYRLPFGRPGGYPFMTKRPDNAPDQFQTFQQASKRIKGDQVLPKNPNFITELHASLPSHRGSSYARKHFSRFLRVLGHHHCFGKQVFTPSKGEDITKPLVEAVLFPTPGLSQWVYRKGFTEAATLVHLHFVPLDSQLGNNP